MSELTQNQHEALANGADDGDIPDAPRLMNEAMAGDDVHDPYLDSYQQLARDSGILA